MVLQNIRVSNGAMRAPTDENIRPPKASSSRPKSLASRIYQDASLRRRARLSGTGSSRTPEQRAERARRRNEAKPRKPVSVNVTVPPTIEDLDAVQSGSSSTLRQQTVPVSIPKDLPRPEFQEISLENLFAVEPDLRGMELAFIRDSMDGAGPDLEESNRRIRLSSPQTTLSSEITVIAPEMTDMLPTHMLAITGNKPPPTQGVDSNPPPLKVALFPVHSLVLLLSCAHIRKPPTALPPPAMGVEEVRLPIWRLGVPSPPTFHIVLSYLYTKNLILLFRALLPIPPPMGFWTDAGQQRVFALRLSTIYKTEALLKYALVVHGVWQNTCALGVDDDQLWEAIELLWRVFLTALAIATGDPGQMLPAPPAFDTL